MIRHGFLFTIFISLISFGCNSNNNKSASSQERMLNLSFQNVRSLDPRIGVDYPSSFAVKMLFEGLTRLGLDKNIEPAIAQSWEISEDQTQYTFHLRACTWSNGDPVTAEDFIYTWKKVLDPRFATTAIHNFYPIKNVQAIIQGKQDIDEIGAKAIDSQTLVIDLEHPTPYLLEVLATSAFLPVNSPRELGTPRQRHQHKTAEGAAQRIDRIPRGYPRSGKLPYSSVEEQSSR